MHSCILQARRNGSNIGPGEDQVGPEKVGQAGPEDQPDQLWS